VIKLSMRVVFTLVVLSVSARVYAQASIAGVVKDSSGAVLPGVTIEAASPALIEKVRTTTTDNTGQFKIEQLRPGAYTVTFTLTGFTSVKREGIALQGSFAAVLNTEMKVGVVEETVVVTGQSPVVDVQSTRQERVLSKEVIEGVPVGRTAQAMGILQPGLTANQNIGGTQSATLTTNGAGTIHGSDAASTRMMLDGVSIMSGDTAGNSTNFLANMGSAQEMTISYAAGTAEQQLGGVVLNIVPQDGGNTFRGSFFGDWVTSSMQNDNFDQSLRDRGLLTINRIKRSYNVNPTFGGPIVKDKLWFLVSGNFVANQNYIGGMFENLNRGNVNAWSYAPGAPAVQDATSKSGNIRLTWQATPKNKFTFYDDEQVKCQCPEVNTTQDPEAAAHWRYPIERVRMVGWTAPITNHVLLEARVGFRNETYANVPSYPAGDPYFQLIPVVEQGGLIPGLNYRSYGGLTGILATMRQTTSTPRYVTASASYITGAHAFKGGIANNYNARSSYETDNNFHVVYRFNNGVPNQITERSTPFSYSTVQPLDLGIYAQDKWTIRQLTLQYGARYDRYRSYAPEVQLGPAPLVPTRNVTLPETTIQSYNDIVPRLAAAYDLTGKGTTALKVTLNKYVLAQGIQTGFMNGNLAPIDALANSVNRSWNPKGTPQTNPNYYVPQCDLTNVLANGDCGTVSDVTFGGKTRSTTSDPDAMSGWGTRPYQWEFSATAQHQLLPRVSVNGGYFRRWFGNFTVIDNFALTAADFDPFNVKAPLDPRLPGGGGYTIGALYNLNPAAVTRPPVNVNSPAANYGNQIQHWNGFDLSVDARRLPGNIVLQGGLSTGRTLTDNCAVLAQIPEANPLGVPYCRQETNYLTQFKMIAVYTVPHVGVQLSTSFQNIPGPLISANQVVPNSAVQPSLGRPLSGGAQNVTVNLVAPGTLYGDRLNQVDLRVGKRFVQGPVRATLNVDVYNLFNASTILGENPTYVNASATGWRVPNNIIQGRFAKLGLQIDF